MTSIELCVKMMQHSVFSERTQERRPSEVKEALKFFFTDEEIKQAKETYSALINDIIRGSA